MNHPIALFVVYLLTALSWLAATVVSMSAVVLGLQPAWWGFISAGSAAICCYSCWKADKLARKFPPTS